MKKNLVTLLIPAFNVALYIHRLLDSILNQTYPEIEVIIINDGSTDNTSEVIASYFDKFKRRGLNITLINQDNAGQAEAINRGLKLVNGEFLAWPDSDDWYASHFAIEKLVNALIEGGADVGVSRCAYQRIEELTGRCSWISYPSYPGIPTNIFKDAVMSKPGFWLEPGGWMVKTEFLDKIIPGRIIYTSRLTGQNSQLLWPYLYYTKCIAIDEPLFCYLIRENSHSRGLFQDYDKKKLQQIEYGKTFDAVIDGIRDLPFDQKQRYHQFIRERINVQKYQLAIEYRKGKDIRNCILAKHKSHIFISIKSEDYFNYILSFFPCSIVLKDKFLRKIKILWNTKI